MDPKKRLSQMNFGEQLDVLLQLLTTTKAEMEKISRLKEDSNMSMKQIHNSFENMKNLFPILQSIKTLIKQLIQDVDKMVLRINNKKAIMRDVDTFIREGRSIIENYRITLESLKHKVIHDKLVEHLYLEVPEDGHICTLFDWANVQDLEVLEKELTSELDQLSSLPEWSNTEVKRIEVKYDHIKDIANNIDEKFNIDVRILKDETFIPYLSEHKKNVDSIYGDILDYQEQLKDAIEMAKKNNIVLNLPSFIGWGDLLESKLDIAHKSYMSISQAEETIISKSADFGNLYTECKNLRSLAAKFAEECKKIVTEFEFLEEEFPKNKQKDESDPYVQLETSYKAWKRFMEAYDAMCNEIRRRSAAQKRCEEIMELYQRELDKLADREDSERKRFKEKYLSPSDTSLPETWKSIPLFTEPVRTYKIVPQNPLNELPTLVSEKSKSKKV